MAIAERTVLLSVMRDSIERKIPVVQADSGRSLRCTITDWTIPDDATATIYVLKPSKAVVYNTCTVDTETNSVVADITNQMIAETGAARAMIEITSDGECVTAFQFILLVRGKISGGTESTNESTALDSLLQEWTEKAEEIAQEATETASTAATAAAKSAEEAAASAEAAAASATLLDELGLSVVDGVVCQTYEGGEE